MVTYCTNGTLSAWDNACVQSVQEEAKKRGIELVFCDPHQRPDEQLTILRTFGAQYATVIAFSPIAATGYGPVLAEIKRADISVVVCNRLIEPDNPLLYTAFLGSDYAAEGRKAGGWLAEKTGGKAVIVELTGLPGTHKTVELKAGFEEALAMHPGMKIVRSQSGEGAYAQGKAAMETFLRPGDLQGISAVFAHNDEIALGSIRAIVSEAEVFDQARGTTQLLMCQY